MRRNVDMFDVFSIEIQWAPVLWLDLLGLCKDIDDNIRKAQQMPTSRVSFLLPGDVACQSRHC